MSVVSKPDQAKAERNEEYIRVAVCGLAPLAGDVVRTLVEQVPFVRVVASLEPSDDLAADFSRSGADVMLCAFPEDEMDRLWREALAGRPPLAVLNMLDDHVRASVYALYPHGRTVEELTKDSLVDALRRHMVALRDTRDL